jgi:deoxyribodipyrimidine photo-lyase
MIEGERINPLNSRNTAKGGYVLYWMQAAQRAEFNHALEYAIRQANNLKQPLLTTFGLTDSYPQANARHYRFMLEGLQETQRALARQGIKLSIEYGSPEMIAVKAAQHASMVVTDRGYTRVQKSWRRYLARRAPCKVVQVETDVVVPVEIAATKDAYSAATLRPKIEKQLSKYLSPLQATRLQRASLDIKRAGLELQDIDKVLSRLHIDHSVKPVGRFHGGTARAKRLLRQFISQKLSKYGSSQSNNPSLDIQSHQSPYLHFGQISPVYIALQVMNAKGVPPRAKQAYLEQLIIRRELSFNFMHYNSYCYSYRACPAWARTTLQAHRKDRRPVIYSLKQLETAQTHDRYWNAAMQEMLLTGKMHNYMRMYWGKKILEWTRSPKEAFRRVLCLNNKYFLDGRDPNSWNNVAWIFGLHDRPWAERPIFGKVRYMNAAGLERKFNIEAYVNSVKA